ncbi:MAG: PQQ-binding-like beta-propeller repeat protein [Lentisphaeria bacterium]|nr:PQQ-binding-like beta-propeller repeat protein [Lentisphaeria bacterium]
MEKGKPVVIWKDLIRKKELKGFKTIKFATSADGYVSLHIRDSEGVVVRQLVNAGYFAKGDHAVKWDGLTTPLFKTPGQPVKTGNYTWHAIHHKGLGLRLRGFASNGGIAAWDNGPKTNWGGDHGVPISAASDGEKVYLGWTGAESGKAMVAVDLKGLVQWKNSRKSTGSASRIAADAGKVYIQSTRGVLYCLDAKTGDFLNWPETKSPDLVLRKMEGIPAAAVSGLHAANGEIYISLKTASMIIVIDAESGELFNMIRIPSPGDLELAKNGKLYVISGSGVFEVDPEAGDKKLVIKNLPRPVTLAIDDKNLLYISTLGVNQIMVFDTEGMQRRTIGRKAIRNLRGPFQRDILASANGLAIDKEGKLWVAESTSYPKRISVWDTKTGKLLKEFYGPTHYGASGGVISPVDPNIMVGEGCEWRLNPKTGKSICTGIIEHRIAGAARFCQVNDKLYLVTGTSGLYRIFERTGEGTYKFLASIKSKNKGKQKETLFWADANGDEKQQDDELRILSGSTNTSGSNAWSMGFNNDLSLTAKNSARGTIHISIASFNKIGAPIYDLKNFKKLPTWGLASPDKKIILSGNPRKGHMLEAFDVASGKKLWHYPSEFHGVHGSHHAPPPEPGLFRGAFGPIGSVTLPDPIGSIWAYNGNMGEWHLLTAEGFYLSAIFQGDPMSIVFPEKPVPGSILDNAPSGTGGEDFGGSMTKGNDGKIYVQSGKTGLWNVEVIGFETVTRIKSNANKIAISNEDTVKAKEMQKGYLRVASGLKQMFAKKMTPSFTGDLTADFKDAKVLSYKKQEAAAVKTVAAWDDTTLYLGWEVKDKTPWINGAKLPEQLFIGGDTVDMQLGTNPSANKRRGKPAAGDLRLSIGNFQGKATAVLYRKVSKLKKKMEFSSGVVKSYIMDYVAVVEDIKIKVSMNKDGKGYVVEVAIPQSALGLSIKSGMDLFADVGVTHGDVGGQRTRLRTYWSNRKTGIVDDAVFELMMEPSRWGRLNFK